MINYAQHSNFEFFFSMFLPEKHIASGLFFATILWCLQMNITLSQEDYASTPDPGGGISGRG
jgi:hypothetical protein